MELVVSSKMEQGGTHRDCRLNRTLSPSSDWASLPEKPPMSHVHTYSRRQLSLRWFTPLVLPLIFVFIILCYMLLVGRGWRLKPQGNHRADGMNCFGLWVISVAVTGLWYNWIWMWWWVRRCMWVEKLRQGQGKQGHSVRLVKWGYKFIITSHKERKGHHWTKPQNRKLVHVNRWDNFLLLSFVWLVCAYPCVWLSMYACWCLRPCTPLCLFSLLSSVGIPPSHQGHEIEALHFLLMMWSINRKSNHSTTAMQTLML